MNCDRPSEDAGTFLRPLGSALLIALAYVGILSLMQDRGVFALIVLFPFILAWLSHCIRLKVSCKAALILLMLLFLFEACFARNYMLRCYEEWPCVPRERFLAESSPGHEDAIPGGHDHGSEHDAAAHEGSEHEADAHEGSKHEAATKHEGSGPDARHGAAAHGDPGDGGSEHEDAPDEDSKPEPEHEDAQDEGSKPEPEHEETPDEGSKPEPEHEDAPDEGSKPGPAAKSGPSPPPSSPPSAAPGAGAQPEGKGRREPKPDAALDKRSELEKTLKKIQDDVEALKRKTTSPVPPVVGAPGRTARNGSNSHRDRAHSCYEDLHDCNVPELPTFRPFADDSSLWGGRLSWSITCPAWTCWLLQQPNKNFWLLWEYFFMVLLTTAVQLLPSTFLCCFRDYAVQSAGAGTCQPWLVWLWLAFLVEWAVLFVLMADDIHYRDIAMLLMHTVEYLLRNTLLVIEILVFTSLFVVAYLNRVKLASFFGMEGQNLFRFGFADIFNPGWRRVWKGGIQVCIWKVTAFQHDVPAPRLKSQASWACFNVTRCCGTSCVKSNSREGREYTQLPAVSREGTVEGETPDTLDETTQLTTHVEMSTSSEQNLLGERGTPYDIFVRLNLGDNETRATIVHYAVDLDAWTEVVFNEPFKFFFCPEQSDELVVCVRNQGVATSVQLGCVKFDCKSLQELVRETERAESDSAWKESRGFQDGQCARRQVRAMLDAEGCIGSEDFQITERMRACGFKRYNLDYGGSIWLAFAKLKPQEGVAGV